jgi:hypothetical protein
MVFEEALKAIREAKKIWHPSFNKDEYLMGCYITINPLLCPDGIEPFKMVQARGMSITWMLGENIHPKMKPKFIPKDDVPFYPQIDLFLLMAYDWEIYEKEIG